ncbi:MAG: DUF983 domain-containing protein [Methylobacteriaceae bacterium]|nr:DUF983 domain-containing protein [Methylobacteriaceae bacterium]
MQRSAGPAVLLPSENAPLAIRRGALGRCPACGEGRIFGRYLKVRDVCDACGTELHHHRADDFPPYIVIFIVAHVVGYGIYLTETRFAGLPLALQAVLWPVVTVGLSLALLQPVKGAVVALQYALGMHGFGRARAVGAGANRESAG